MPKGKLTPEQIEAMVAKTKQTKEENERVLGTIEIVNGNDKRLITIRIDSNQWILEGFSNNNYYYSSFVSMIQDIFNMGFKFYLNNLEIDGILGAYQKALLNIEDVYKYADESINIYKNRLAKIEDESETR